MELVTRILLLVALGGALTIANIWYIRTAIRSFRGGDLVVAPVTVTGLAASNPSLDSALARMLVMRLRAINAEFETAQKDLKSNDKSNVALEQAILGRPRTLRFDTQVFSPTALEAKVAGVDVGGLVPRFERWFVSNRTLSFDVSIEDQTATVTGDVSALGADGRDPIWIRTTTRSPEAIVDQLAYAVLQRMWARDEPETKELNPQEFRTVVQAVVRVARINRDIRASHRPQPEEFASVLDDINPIVDRMNGRWAALSRFAATIAEGAVDNPRAAELLTQARNSPMTKPEDAKALDLKIASLESGVTKATQVSYSSYESQRDDAQRRLQSLFGAPPIPPVPIKLLTEKNFKNAYWDGKAINIPPGLEDMPDLVTHELAWAFVQSRWKGFVYEGDVGAIGQSYTDILTAYVTQQRLGQTAATADWTIAPGAIAWITDKPRTGGRDQAPLRSMRAPGTAYDDKALGKDRQVSNYASRVKGQAFGGEVQLNSGIGNKAFYEAARVIGTPEAAEIWVASLPGFGSKTDYPAAARDIRATAARLHGQGSPEYQAVDAAWRSVGLP